MKAQLLCRLRGGSTQTFSVRGEESVIGRDPGIAVSVPLEGISRRHARIRFDGKSYWIEDLTSTNGTFLNGRPVRKERLRHLDVITLGRKADLLFVLRSEEPQVVKRQGIVRAALVPGESPDAIPHEVPVGETTLGRSSVCNVRVESTTASKMHAHVRRSVDQLVVQDLGSSNGTFVNGERVTITELRDGDILSLGGVENYKVVIEVGEVTTSSGAHALPVGEAPPAPARPRFSDAWKTRFEWDPDELKVIAEVQQAGLASQRGTTAKPKDKPLGTRPPQQASAPKAPPAAKPAPPKPPASKPPTTKPPAPASQPPSEPKTMAPGAGAQRTPGTKPPEPATQPPSEPRTLPPSAIAQPPSPPAVPPRAAAPPAAAAAPRPSPPGRPGPDEASPTSEPTVADKVPGFVASQASPASASPGRIVELRLRGGGYDLVVTESGAHSLGRAKEAPLRVDHQTVSRKHARIILSDDRTVSYLQDLGGANGTLLNGVALQELKPLKEGDRIQVGQVELTVSFTRK